VGVKPGADQLTTMPGGVVPDQDQDPLARLGELLATPVQELRGHRAHRSALRHPRSHICCTGGAAGR